MNNKLVIGVGAVIVAAITVGLIVWLVAGGDSQSGQIETPRIDAAPTSGTYTAGPETSTSRAEVSPPPQLAYAKPVPEDGWVKWEDTELLGRVFKLCSRTKLTRYDHFLRPPALV